MIKLTKGFTFVELMVVIGIASIMFAIATVTFTDINKSSRDARRKSDMEAIRQALELCRGTTGSYPAAVASAVPSPLTCGSQTFLSSVPVDPKDGITKYTYTPVGGTTYTLSTSLMEKETNPHTLTQP